MIEKKRLLRRMALLSLAFVLFISAAWARKTFEYPGFEDRPVVPVDDPWSRTQGAFDQRTGEVEVAWNGDGQQKGVVTIDFRSGSSMVVADYKENRGNLERLRGWLSDEQISQKIDSIVITAGSSPDGGESVNENLAIARARAMKSYIMWKFPQMDRDRIYTFSAGEDWVGLRRLVAEDTAMPYRDQVLGVIDDEHDHDARLARLRTIGGGEAYDYLSANMIPRLRRTTVALILLKPVEPVVEPAPVEEAKTVVEEVAAEAGERKAIFVEAPEAEQTIRAAAPVVPGERRPLFAVKTNLLYDVATAINLEIEVPIGRRWSIAGEYVFPWWRVRKKHMALQLIAGTIEPRYWFGRRENRPQLTGWFAGVYGGGGYYDVGWRTRGDQGTFFHVGVSGGYAHAISKNKNWRLEYSLGVGYMGVWYREYIPKAGADGETCLSCKKRNELHWFGPTRAKVSLVWMIDYDRRVR